MFRTLFGSITGKIASLALLIAGLTGGMAATGDVSRYVSLVVDTQKAPAVPVASPPPAVALDFPSSILAKPSPPPSPPEPEPAPVEVVVEAPAPTRVAAAKPAAPPPCVGQLQGLVNALTGTLQAITSPDQAQQVLAQAGTIGEASKQCSSQVAAAGNVGLNELGGLTGQLASLVQQVQALPILSAGTDAQGNPVQAGLGLVATGLEVTLGTVNKGLELLLSPLN